MKLPTKHKQNPPLEASRRPRGSATLSNPFVLAASVAILLLMSGVKLRAQNSQFGCSTNTPQYCAGSTNPIAKPADAVVFPVKGMAVFAPGTSGTGLTFLQTFTADTDGKTMDAAQKWPGVPFVPDAYYAAAAGRIIAPGKQVNGSAGYPEDVVYAWRTGNNVQVNFFNQTNDAKYGNIQLPPNSWDGWKIAPRLDLPTYGATNDHIAIAVGDLDGAVDSNGETSDEVVVAFPAYDPTDNVWVPQIRVLNYGGASTSTASQVLPAISENDTHHNICPGCFVTAASFKTDGQNQGKILASGSIISLAIGDFDGDGQNEIAMATVVDGQTILVSMFRYKNNGDFTKAGMIFLSNTVVSTTQQYLGSVSLAAGDFNNDGKDELALAYATWTKHSTKTPGQSGENLVCAKWLDGLSPLDPCDYQGYAIDYINHVQILSSQLQAATVQSSSTAAGANTYIPLPNAQQLVSGNVFVSGFAGNWSGLNATWPVLWPDGGGFYIPVDTRTLGVAPATTVSLSTTAAFAALQDLPINPRIDNPYDFHLPASFDFRDSNSRPTIQLVSGLFTMDPNGASSFHQRQLLAVWNTPAPADINTLQDGNFTPVPTWKNDLVAGYITVSTDGNNSPTLASLASLDESAYKKNSYGYPHQRFSLTASNFFGASQSNDAANVTPPTWQFGIGAWLDNGGYHVRFGNIDAKTKAITVNQNVTLPNGIQSNYNAWAAFPVVAYDPDGSSYFLGAPVHMSVSTFKSPYFVLQEPPKHMAWIKATNGTYNMLNMNRNSAVNSSVTVGTSASDGTTAVATSGWDIANSVSVSASATWTEGDPKIEGSEQSVKDTLKLGYERQASNSQTTARGGTTVYQATQQAPNDDYIELNATNFDVWRYRIYGGGPATDSSGNTVNKFYEVVVPGVPSVNGGGGQNADWYNPQHENGNVLSYPSYSGASQTPADLSPTPYQVDGQTPPGVTNGMMWNKNGICTGAAKNTYNLEVSGTTSSSRTISTNNTFEESNDLNVGTTVQANVFGLGVGYSASIDWSFDAKESFGQANTSDNSTTANTAFNFDTAPSSTGEWMIYPVLYNSLSGAVKMSYTVDIPSQTHPVSGCSDENNTFTTFYTAPDPALMLPYRWTQSGTDDSGNEIWGLTPGHDREQLKSLFVESVDQNKLATTDPNNPVYDKLASVPNAGTQVRLAVPIYNYSVANSANNVTVQFSYIPVSSGQDPADAYNNEWGCGNPTGTDWVCPDSYRQPLKNNDGSLVQVIIPTIPAWGDPGNPNWKMATATWTIPERMANTKYRIYVNLIYNGVGLQAESNPPQAVCTKAPCPTLCPLGTGMACTAPTQNQDPLAPGQNNEGFKDFQIGPVAAVSATPLTTPAPAKSHTTDDSLVAMVGGTAVKWLVLGHPGQPIELRVSAIANGWENRDRQVTVTDQTAQDRLPALIADKTLQGVGTLGSTAFFEWMPREAGIHALQVRLRQIDNSSAQNDDTSYLLALILRRPGDINGDGFVDNADLSLLEQNKGKSVSDSSCGFVCDLNGDGYIGNADEDIAISMCSQANCARVGNEKIKPVSFSEIRTVNEAEVAQLRNLRPSDWSLLFAQAEGPGGSVADALYLKALQRLAAPPAKGGGTSK